MGNGLRISDKVLWWSMILTVWEIDFSIKCALIECLKLKKKRCLQEASVTVSWQGQDAVVQDALVQDIIA